MEKETKHYVEYLNHDLNRLNTINIEIDKFLINHEYINFFIIMYMQCIKEDGPTSSSQKLIIPCLPFFEKLALSQFQLYIETQTTTQCFVCHNCKTKSHLICWRKRKGFCILHMLRIHTGLRKLSKTSLYDLHLNKRIHLILVYHALILQGVNCYLNNI